MSKAPSKKQPAWFYIVLVLQTLGIIIAIGMLRDLMWIF